MKGEKYTAIYQDQRIAEEFCNFRCDYCEGFCPSGYSLKKDRDGNLAVPDTWHEKIANQPKETRDYFSEGVDLDKFFELSKDVMSKTREAVCADVLKISGGEVTLHDNLVDEVASIHDKYPMVQILTNGLNLNESQIDKYKEMGNICFQVSLDGTTHEGNYARTHNESITKKVLDNIDKMLDKGIGVEINCVLTKHNTNKLMYQSIEGHSAHHHLLLRHFHYCLLSKPIPPRERILPKGQWQ